jgi:hypothetical protein
MMQLQSYFGIKKYSPDEIGFGCRFQPLKIICEKFADGVIGNKNLVYIPKIEGKTINYYCAQINPNSKTTAWYK